MKALIISLFLFVTSFAQDGVTRFFIDNTASGSNNGTSWTNAWETFEAISWATITAGDTIYVSDGTYIATADNVDASIVIGSQVTPYSFASGSPVIICPSWESAHSGEVVITYHNVNQSRILETYGISNIKIYGFKLLDDRTAFYGFYGYVGGWEISNNYDSLITIENCHYISAGHNQGFYFTGHKTIIKNSIFENLENSGDDPQDMFGIAGGSGEITFDGNLVLNRSTSLTTTEHADGIQFSNFGSNLSSTVDVVIRNNVILHLGTSVAWTGLIYSSNPRINCNFYIYNNIIGTNNPNATTCAIIANQPDTTDTWIQSTFIFNNTLITHGDGTGLATPIVVSNDYPHKGIDTLFIKNNLMIADAPIDQFLNLQINYGTNEYVRDVDYNGYYEYGGLLGNFTNGDGFGSYTYTDWIGLGYDAHSDTGNSVNVTFTDKFDTLATGYYTETGRDLGIDLSTEYPDIVAKFPDLAYDILGNPRTGNWDMGALEYRPPLRKWVGLGHSVMERLWDYGAKLGDDSSTVPTMLEEVYRQFNSQHSWGADSIAAESRYFPATYGTSWWAWQSSFRGTIDDGSGAWLVGLIDTFDVIIIKGSINSTVMTGYGSSADTSGSGTTYQTMYNYKWQWRTILDVMKQHPEKFFVMMTGVPSPDWYNTPTGAQLSYEFCTWAKDTLANGLDSYGAFPENVYVFDLFHYLSDSEHYLRDEYELSGADEHPNSEAIRYVEPIWINEVGNAVLAFDGVVETPADTMPSFSFTALNNMELNTAYIGSATFSGADSTFTVYTTTGARFNINSSSSLSTTPKTAVNGDVVYVETVTGLSYSTGYTETIVAGGVSRDFTVTTESAPTPPSGNGGWLKQSNGTGIITSDGKRLITRTIEYQAPISSVYYVSADAVGGGIGSYEDEFTLDEAAIILTAGDTAIIKMGLYSLTDSLTFSNDGTSSNPIVFIGEKINGYDPKTVDEDSITTFYCDYQSAGESGTLHISGDYITIKNINFYQNKVAEILEVQGQNFTLDSCNFQYPSNTLSTDFHTVMVNHNADSCSIKNSYFWRNPRTAIFVRGGLTEADSPDDFLMDGCTITESSNHPAFQMMLGTSYNPIGAIPVSGAILRNNLFLNNSYFSNIYIRHQKNFKVYNNLIINSGGLFDMTTPVPSGGERDTCNTEGSLIVYNTVYDTINVANSWMMRNVSGGNQLIIQNNLIISEEARNNTYFGDFRPEGATPTSLLRHTIDYNSYAFLTENATGKTIIWNATNYYLGTTWTSGLGFDTNSILDDLTTFDDLIDFVPSSGSSVIGAGTPIIGITTDREGNTRSLTTPTIGAVEVIP